MSWNNYTPPNDSIGTGPATAVTQVVETMARMQQQVNNYTTKVDATLAGLQALTVTPAGPAPDVKIDRPGGQLNWTVQPPTGLQLDDLSEVVPASPGVPTFQPISADLNLPKFEPGVTITLPTAPAPISTDGVPLRPDIDTAVDLPVRPQLIQPIMEAFEAINIPTFTFPTFPDFTDEAPTFDVAAPNVNIEWHEPVYASENFDLVLATVRRMISGGTGLPDEIERQLFDKARGREDITARKAVQEAFSTFASKGFTMPPGMLVEQVNAVQEQNQLAANSLSRDIYAKVADIHVENMRQAVQQGVAAENVLVNIFNNAQTRAFEMARFTVESQLSLYNAQVGLFNSYMTAYQTKANVFKIRLDAQLAELDVYRIQLEGQKIVSEINMQKVQTFLAKTQALTSQVEVYKAEMQGAQVKASVVQAQIDAYRADVSAYAEKIGAEKVRFDAYKSQVDGEVAKVGIIDANARVFASLAGVEQSRADIRIKTGQLQIEQSQAVTQRFAAEIEQSRALITAKMARIDAQARLLTIGIQNMSAQSDANRAKAEAEIRIAEQQLQSNLAGVQSQLKLYEVGINRTVEEARLKVAAMQAAGTMAATLAGGAMAAQHVQASISSNSSESNSKSFSSAESASENWNYTPTTT